MAGFLDSTPKRRTSSVRQISAEGLQLVEELLADGKSYAAIIGELRAATGEVISRSALSRFRVTDYEPTRKRIEAARATATELASLLQDSTSVETKFNATAQGLFDIMLQRVMEAKGADVTKLMREARMFQQVRNNVRRLENDERRIGIETEKLGLERRELDKKLADFEARQAAAKSAAQELVGDQQLSEEKKQRIRDLYGL